jgi:hypothetical protein
MVTFMLSHAHRPEECRVVAAAWRGFQSPLRHRAALCSCATGGHRLWWEVEAQDEAQALGLLPLYVSSRTHAEEVRPIWVP